jgi:hypothetical protein
LNAFGCSIASAFFWLWQSQVDERNQEPIRVIPSGGNRFLRSIAMSQIQKNTDPEADPITPAPIVATGLGAAAGAVTGNVAGPIGAALDAAAGFVAKLIDSSVEDEYGRENYSPRHHARKSSTDDFAPASRYEWDSGGKRSGSQSEDVKPDRQRDWDGAKGNSSLQWQNAKPVARDGWDRLAARH